MSFEQTSLKRATRSEARESIAASKLHRESLRLCARTYHGRTERTNSFRLWTTKHLPSINTTSAGMREQYTDKMSVGSNKKRTRFSLCILVTYEAAKMRHLYHRNKEFCKRLREGQASKSRRNRYLRARPSFSSSDKT